MVQRTQSPTGYRRSGIGWRTPHYHQLLDVSPAIGFIEVHSENFFGRGDAPLGGPAAQVLQRARSRYALSLHGVGMSLGSVAAPDSRHLEQLVQLVERVEPEWVSEHLSWSAAGGICANDLLPLPYTEEALVVVAANVQRLQERLQRTISIENPSRYLAFRHSPIDETEFLGELCRRTGCDLLLDINNVYVSAQNLGFDAGLYLRNFPAHAVAEIHLAGHVRQGELLIDTHSRPVAEPVWQLYSAFLREHGDRPTLIEWDEDIPELTVLLNEAGRADDIRRECTAALDRSGDRHRHFDQRRRALPTGVGQC